MRALPIVAAGLVIGIAGSATSLTAVASGRQASFARNASALEQRWDADIAAGEPAATLEPLRSQLAASAYSKTPGWSPLWWFGTGQSLLDGLTARTARDWTAAMASARSQAASVFTSWEQMAAQMSPYVPAASVSAEAQWSQELADAATPVAVERLIRQWTGDITTARDAALLTQLNAEVSVFGGLNGLISQANAAVAKARRDK